MAQVSYLWQQFLILMNSLVGSLSWRNILDVAVVDLGLRRPRRRDAGI